MRLAGFLTGMCGAAVLVAGATWRVGFSGWAIAGFVAATLVTSQLLYLGLILLMVHEESYSREERKPSDSTADALLPIRDSQQSGY
ncbi:hypothetical protein [Rhodobacter sp. NSM]|uniref:hypothetical protein n=1 Tax=Rhodobacter sp. NSM TaxID=3457501 RepID=UPI003FD14CF6